MLHQLKQRLAPDCIPIFTSDQLRSYFTALTSHFGEFRQEWARRKPVWRVSPKLLYALLIAVEGSSKSALADASSLPSPFPFSILAVRFAMPFRHSVSQSESKLLSWKGQT